MAFLELIGVKKRYGEKEVLKGIGFSVNEGEIFSLLGPNGAGKTTLMRIIAEGIKYEGDIRLDGKPIEKMRHRIGYCPQEGIIYDFLTVKENLEFYADLYHSDRKILEHFIRIFDLPSNKRADKLSGGMKKKLSLSVALLHSPDLVVLDEPTTGLDVQSRLELWNAIKGLKKDGKTVIISTHYMEEAERLSDVVGIMDEGRIISMGKVDKLKKRAGLKGAVEIRGDFRDIPEGFIHKGESIVHYAENPSEFLVEAVKIASEYGKIREAVVREPTLEDVFIKLTGKKLEEDGR